MKTAFFGAKPYERKSFDEVNLRYRKQLVYFDSHLNSMTTNLACDSQAVCVFVNDTLDSKVLEKLSAGGTRFIALRSAGFNHVDLRTALDLGMKVARVPAYSPYAVAEHAMALILDLNRKIHRAYARVREGNFSLDGLLGFDLQGKKVGVIGTGKIGLSIIRILKGFDCEVLAYNRSVNPECVSLGARYVSLEEMLKESDIITLHCPLTPETHHIISEEAIAQMKDGVMLINTGRGALLDTVAIIQGLKTGKIGHLGLDVYDEETSLFFEDLSNTIIQDDVYSRLMTFPNVVLTGHQAFLTKEALGSIAEVTLKNIDDFEAGRECPNEINC